MPVVRTQSHANQCARVRNALALPALVSLITAHGCLRGIIPLTGGLAAHVALANERSLDLARTLAVNSLLPTRPTRLLAAVVRNFVGFRRGVRGRFLRSLS
jgi:hypothetical protein